MSNEAKLDISEIKNAIGNIDRIEFDITVQVAKGISMKGTVFVKRNIEDGN